MNKKVIFALTLVVIVVLSYIGLTRNSIKNDKVYPIEDETPSKDIVKIDSEIRSKSNNEFYDVSSFTDDLNADSILVTVSKDGDSIFYLSPSLAKEKDSSRILKGRTSLKMALFRKQLSTGKATEVAPSIPFITSAKWSPNGNFVAFRAEGFALLYSLDKNSAVMQKELSKEPIEDISWSTDSKKLYLEYTTIPNGGVIYVDSLKLAQSYELKEEIFPKDSLEGNYYFGVKQNINTSTAMLSTCITLIMDDQGKKLVGLSPGIYKDSFKKSVLLKNLNNTYSYIKDFSSDNKPIKLTEKVVYDGGFLYDGGIYYITESTNSTENKFTLHRLDKTGKEITSYEILGSTILLMPDGKRAYVNGPNLEFIDFESNTIPARSDKKYMEYEVISTLSSALRDVKHSLTSGETIKNSPYFTSSASSEVDRLINMAYSSVSDSFRDLYISLNPEDRVLLNNLTIKENHTADAELQITVRTYWLKEFKGTCKVKLIEDSNQWKINEIHFK